MSCNRLLVVLVLSSLTASTGCKAAPPPPSPPAPKAWPAPKGGGDIDCGGCRGKGTCCRPCVGSGRVWLSGTSQTTIVLCNACGGSGRFGIYKCNPCNGSGRRNETQMGGGQAQCIACKGTGDGSEKCDFCKGSGRLYYRIEPPTDNQQSQRIENQEFRDWVKFGIGAWRIQKSSFTNPDKPERNSSNVIEIQTATSISLEKVSYEIRVGEKIVDNGEITQLIEDLNWQTLAEGTETIEFSNTKVPCHWLERIATRGKYQTWHKVWFYDAIPGGWIRFQYRSLFDGKMTSHGEISVLDGGRAEKKR